MGKFLASFAGLMIGLTLIELGLHRYWQQEDVHLYQIGDDGLFFHSPNFDNLTASSPYAAILELRKRLKASARDIKFDKLRVKTNAFGERDQRTHSLAKAPGQFRIIAVGPCITFGLDVPEEKTFLRLLEQRIPSTETINCSFQGASPAEARDVYEKACSRYEADIVLNSTLLQDLGTSPFRGRMLGADRRLVTLIYKELGEKTAELIELDTDGLPRLKAAAREEWLPKLRYHYSPHLPFYHSLELVRFLENRWTDFSLIPFPEQKMKPLFDKIYGVADRDRYARISLENHLKELRKLKSLVTTKGSRLVVVIFPERDVLFPRNYSPEISWFREQLFKEFDVLDLKPKIAPAEWSRMVVNEHMPSAAGHVWLADRIGETIQSRYRDDAHEK